MLAQRDVEERRGRLEQVAILRVDRHTDDLKPLTLELNPAADGLLSRPDLSGHGLVHDRHRQPALVVGACELAAGGEWDSHRGEEPRTDFVVLDGQLLVGRWNITVDHHRRRRVGAIAERRQT